MPAKKRHHFVPKLYLRRFSADQASVRLCNMKSGHIVDTAPIKGQCYRDYMYGKTPEREDALGKLEGIAQKALDFVITHGRLPSRQSGLRTTILMFIALQYGRTAYTADAMDETVEKLARRLSQHDPRLEEFFEKGGRVGVTNGASFGVEAALECYPQMADLRWALVKAAPGMEFLASDTPAVFYNQSFEGRLDRCTTGWSWKGLQCIFPVSPSYTILLFDASIYRVRRDELIQATTEDTVQLNVLQCAAAYENVYFLGMSRASVISARNRAMAMRRMNKVRLTVRREELPNSDHEKHLLFTEKEDVNVGLKLSFVSITKSGKLWIDQFMCRSPLPRVAIRNEWLNEGYSRFRQAVKIGTYRPTEFQKFLIEEFQRSEQMDKARSLLNPRQAT